MSNVKDPAPTVRSNENAIFLDPLFGDNMILQRGKPVPVRGTAEPGAFVSAEIQGKAADGRADADGSFCLALPPLSASDSETLTLRARSRDHPDGAEISLQLQNVAVGEVWIAGGQSNMEFWMRYEAHRAKEGAACPLKRLRFYDVPKVCYNGQLEEFDYGRMGFWRMATDEDLDYFSAVAYYFQKELSEDLDIPVGVIGCNWGGTVSAAWMDPETFMRIGGPWLDWLGQRTAYRDMDSYIASQHGKPTNDHGNPFGDYFLETVLPRTLSREEAEIFLSTLPDGTAAIFEDYMTHPQPQSVPGSLYEHMLRPLSSFPVSGVLWYQGEGDEEFGMAGHYAAMLTGLIGDWRRLFRDESLPFLIVQIPGFSNWLLDPPVKNLPDVRRCQEEVCDTLPGALLCSASDAGAETDAHPKDKTAIGRRLALLARRHVYGEDILSDAPRAGGVEKEGTRLTLTFENAGEGLYIEGERLNALEIYDKERHYGFDAEAEGDRLRLTLKTPCGDGPLTLSFAGTNFYRVNLYNSAGIPAVPFQYVV